MASFHIMQGDNLPSLRALADGFIDACVTDPPYELGFMGRKWDASGVAYDVERWREVLRVLKPGGYLLAFGGARTYHRMACAIEDAGFEIRDSIHWVYGSGFPKSLDVSKAIDAHLGAERGSDGYVPNNRNECFGSGLGGGHKTHADPSHTPQAKQWDGWGTAIKPAHEPIVVARKPLIGTVAENVLAHGTGGINLDGCRIALDTRANTTAVQRQHLAPAINFGASGLIGKEVQTYDPSGRFPPNILLTHSEACGETCVEGCPVLEMDRQSGNRPGMFGAIDCEANARGDDGGASRFFPVFRYAAKAGRSEREWGCEALPARTRGEITERDDDAPGCDNPRSGKRASGGIRNTHPTVKPVALMKWLVRLITPPGGTVLDPYAGSGTTGIACVTQGFAFIGCELEPEHVKIAEARIKFWRRFPGGEATAKQEVESERAGQLSLLGGT